MQNELNPIKPPYVKTTGIICSNCHYLVISRARHDYRSCFCGACAIDGGFDYTKISYKDTAVAITTQVIIPGSNKELYDDWNYERDMLGLYEKWDYAIGKNGEQLYAYPL